MASALGFCSVDKRIIFRVALVSLFFSFSFYGLHTLRNIFPFFIVLAPLCALFSVLLLSLVISFRADGFFSGVGGVLFCLFSAISFFPIFVSFYYYDEKYIESFARYFYTLPFFWAASTLAVLRYGLDGIFKAYIFLILLGAGSIFYQIFWGAVPWFPDSSERDGFTRYSSILGSLTIFGVAGGLALPVIYFSNFSSFKKTTFICFVVLAMLLSLQKAAVLNVFVFFLFVVYRMCVARKFLYVSSVLLFVLILLLSTFYFEIPYVSSSINNVLRFRSDVAYADYSVFQSVYDRFLSLPSVLFDLHGAGAVLTGVGMVGGSGVLGFPEYPMAHNVYVDYLFVGGVLYLFMFLFCFFYAWRRFFVLARMSRRGDSGTYTTAKFVFLLYFINFPFTSGVQYHPVLGVLLLGLIAYGLLVRITDRKDIKNV